MKPPIVKPAKRLRANPAQLPKAAAPARIVPHEIVPALLSWFERNARDLPWRASDPSTGRRDPYRVLVSEVMLQQTQVSRVNEKFAAFLLRFPDIAALASAPVDDVLAAWTGLGYYRRARMLHACARAIQERWGGRVPESVESLSDLPGIGAYTAGAIASLAFGGGEPVVDTNVARVLLRVGGMDLATSDKEAIAWAWFEAGQLVRCAADRHHAPRARFRNRPGAWNEALMELGATICVLPAPRCTLCPISAHCKAFGDATTDRIPLKSRKASRASVRHFSLLVHDAQGRVLVEQRPATGLWAGLWQLPTLERADVEDVERVEAAEVARELGFRLPARARWRALKPFVFKTTHRDVHFVIHELLTSAPQSGTPQKTRRWCDQSLFEQLGWSSPMKRLVRDAITASGAVATPPCERQAARAPAATRSARR